MQRGTNIFNPHERAALADAAEEPIDDASCHVGRQACCDSRPHAGTPGNALPDYGDRQAAPVIREHDNEEAAGADHQDIADNSLLRLILRNVPYTVIN